MDTQLLNQAYGDWQNFLNQLPERERMNLPDYAEAIASTELYHHIVDNDFEKFDLAVSRLSKGYLYSEETVPFIYNAYVSRDLHEMAHNYINEARGYYERNEEAVPTSIRVIAEQAVTNQLLVKYKDALNGVRGLAYSDIPRVIPDAINDKRSLDEFILNEIVQASRIVIDKVHSVSQISHENRYNDLLLSTLRLRFPFYGWSIQDQPRMGSSPTGKDAGIVDILIQSAGTNIGFIEALVLSRKNRQYIENHILKCFTYVSYLERYYVVIYFKGPRQKFEHVWSVYEKTIFEVCFPDEVSLDLKTGFIELSEDFSDARHLRIAKTNHSNGIVMYHLMINLS